ncbi:hypothetical protein VNO80_29580 [Phaseolus coccineus]|uniref:Uncharacterized protein n=1 Tax=Phaseolus coccineus TaxID=3886 RepID=A0AAN9QF10_PHACN
MILCWTWSSSNFASLAYPFEGNSTRTYLSKTHDSSSALNTDVAPKGRNSKLRYGICFGLGASSTNDIQTRI